MHDVRHIWSLKFPFLLHWLENLRFQLPLLAWMEIIDLLTQIFIRAFFAHLLDDSNVSPICNKSNSQPNKCFPHIWSSKKVSFSCKNGEWITNKDILGQDSSTIKLSNMYGQSFDYTNSTKSYIIFIDNRLRCFFWHGFNAQRKRLLIT